MHHHQTTTYHEFQKGQLNLQGRETFSFLQAFWMGHVPWPPNKFTWSNKCTIKHIWIILGLHKRPNDLITSCVIFRVVALPRCTALTKGNATRRPIHKVEWFKEFTHFFMNEVPPPVDCFSWRRSYPLLTACPHQCSKMWHHTRQTVYSSSESLHIFDLRLETRTLYVAEGNSSSDP